MALYKGTGSDERKLKALVFVFLFLLLIGYGVTWKREQLVKARGVVLVEKQGKSYSYFCDTWGDPVFEEELPYGEGKSTKKYGRFINHSIQEKDTVSYSFWKVESNLYIGGCFVVDSVDEWRAKVVLQLTTDQLFGD